MFRKSGDHTVITHFPLIAQAENVVEIETGNRVFAKGNGGPRGRLDELPVVIGKEAGQYGGKWPAGARRFPPDCKQPQVSGAVLVFQLK